ncbi:hypothetical protein, partial [Tritonibacter sp. SIMBA_163]|uniref:hypothetical protein n=1 Tax=Tritonibacter sp. SIMBA_163 TaxID=3080868 RepID=UPI0039815ACE
MYADALRRFLGCRGNLIFLTTSVVSLAAAASIGFDAWTPLWLAIGVITYAPQEHLVHKFIFHAPAPRNRFL